jgi:hypothetical protein
MTDKIRKADYFYTHVPDTPGEAFRLLSKLREGGINLVAFSAFPSGGNKSQVDLVPESAEPFLKACKQAGISITGPKQCFLIDGADRPGAVADLLKRLADSKINVTATDAVCSGGGRYGAILWVKPEAMPAAAKALGV